MNKEKLLETLHRQKVYISVRGEAIRISPSVYNTTQDIELLIQILEENNRP